MPVVLVTKWRVNRVSEVRPQGPTAVGEHRLRDAPFGSPGRPGNGKVDSTTVYTFEDDEVFGTTTAPIGEVLLVRPREQRESLIRARDHFVRELLHSVEEL